VRNTFLNVIGQGEVKIMSKVMVSKQEKSHEHVTNEAFPVYMHKAYAD